MQLQDEDKLIDEIEKSTTAWRTQGEWITKLHLEGKGGGTLWIKNMKKLGECDVACKTIEKAMRSVMGERDTDVAEALYMVRTGGGFFFFGFFFLNACWCEVLFALVRRRRV